MVEEKKWHQSTTIWGGLLAATASISSMFGIDLDHLTHMEVANTMVQLSGAIGALIAIYGRLNATQVIS